MTAALLGDPPIIPDEDQPRYPISGPIEAAMLAEITESGKWVGFRWKPAKWRAIFEQVVAPTMGYRYGVGYTNGTNGVAGGIRVQIRAKSKKWAKGRTQFLVPNFTCLPAYMGVLLGVAAELGVTPELVPIDARPDGTMSEEACEAYLKEHSEQVIGILPTTMYCTYGDITAFVMLGRQYDVVVHHDDAHGAAAMLEGEHAPTGSISCHADAKPTAGPEAGGVFTDNAELANLLRADTDCGVGAGRLDPIPYLGGDPIPAGNQRMGEQTAGLTLVQYLRGLHDRLQARENRRQIHELLADRFPESPLLWHPEADAEYPPFYMFFALCTNALETELEISPAVVRQFFTAEGMFAEQPYVPAHLDKVWQNWCNGRAFPVSDMVYERGFIIHTKFLRHEKFVPWFTAIFDRLIHSAPRLRNAA